MRFICDAIPKCTVREWGGQTGKRATLIIGSILTGDPLESVWNTPRIVSLRGKGTEAFIHQLLPLIA